MYFDKFKGKICFIKAMNDNGRIENVIQRKNSSNQLTVRYLVNRPDGQQVEYEPHEIEIDLTEPVLEEELTLNETNNHEQHTGTIESSEPDDTAASAVGASEGN